MSDSNLDPALQQTIQSMQREIQELKAQVKQLQEHDIKHICAQVKQLQVFNDSYQWWKLQIVDITIRNWL